VHVRVRFRPALSLLAPACITLLVSAGPTEAASVDSAPALPITGARIVNVSSEGELQAAVASLSSGTTIVLAAGTYTLTSTIWINGTFADVTIRGATNNRDDVVLVGPGMTNGNYGNVPYGIWVGGNVQRVLIANLTIRDVYYHPVIFNAGTQAPHLYNVRLLNAGQQFVKSNPDGAGAGVNDGIVEFSVFEYTTTSRDEYTNGVDVHTGTNWVIRNNLFRNIRAPEGQLAGPAVLMWNGSTGTITDGNTFMNCQREIAYGLVERTPNDHSGGVIRNNFIYRASGTYGDVAIGVFDSANTQVLHNTILLSSTYASPIEYRFANTVGVNITNNLLDGQIQARDGASAAVTNNYTGASAAMFISPSAGDLHLQPTASNAIDRGVAAGVSTDWDGQARPAGAAPDIGADEYSGGTPPAAPKNLRIVS
jgi:hypothetical protein